MVSRRRLAVVAELPECNSHRGIPGTISGVSADQTRRPAGDDPAPWVIDRFDGEHGWLSNFGAGECELDGVTYRSREHAFQAGKSEDPTYRAKVRAAATPGAAKGLGRRAVLRPDWDATVRFTIMEQVLQSAFTRTTLRQQLVGTGDALLIEGTGLNPRHCERSGSGGLRFRAGVSVWS